MSAYSKHAWLVIAVSLAASTAQAAIPDANGVIHGCYNLLTGTAKIVEGTNCGLLEKAVTWQQTGPKGPAGNSVTGMSLNAGNANCPAGGVALTLAGATSYICNGLKGPPGPQGPVGPSGSADIVVGSGILNLSNPLSPVRSNHAILESEPIIALRDGVCILTVTGTQLEATPGLWFQPVSKRDDGQTTFHFQRAIMQVSPTIGGGEFAAGTAMDAFEVIAGRTYKVGVGLAADPDPIFVARNVGFTLSWVCKFDPAVN